MPIYAYACKHCEHHLDALQKISDDPLVDCPECGKPGLKRLLSAPRFRLKGSGWYETDFKTDNKRNLAASDNDKPGDAGSKDEKKADSGKAETKPAETKTATKAASGDSKDSKAS